MRSTHRLSHWLCSAIALSLFCAVSTRTQSLEKQFSKLKPFSADQIRVIRGKTATGKFYFTLSAIRTEGVDPKGNKSIQIMRFDQKVMWNVLPAQKMYIEMPGSSLADWASWADSQAVLQRESLGMEQVGDFRCEKFLVHVKVMGHEATSFEWDAKELDGLPVKTQDEKGDWSIEYRNVQIGPQDPALFEVPAGYQKMSLGGGMQKP